MGRRPGSRFVRLPRPDVSALAGGKICRPVHVWLCKTTLALVAIDLVYAQHLGILERPFGEFDVNGLGFFGRVNHELTFVYLVCRLLLEKKKCYSHIIAQCSL